MFKHLFGLCLLMVSGAAFAQPAPGAGGGMGQILILGVFVLFFFWMIRSQNKKAKEHRNLIDKLEKGDELITSGGLLGKVTKVGDNFLGVQLAEGIEVFLQKSMVANSVPKGTMRSI